MYTIRCTQVLLKKLGLKVRDLSTGGEPTATTCLGDWYANRLNLGHKRFLLCTNEQSLLTVVVPAKDLRSLPSRLADAVGRLLQTLGVPVNQIAAELSQMEASRYGRTTSRVVLGSMNDFAWLAEGYILEGGMEDLNAVSKMISESPSSPIKYESPVDLAPQLLQSCYGAARTGP
jgi:hypothetical protein